jgi:hypothetical protein
MSYRKHAVSKAARKAHHKREKKRRKILSAKGQIDPFGYFDMRGKSRRKLAIHSVTKGARDGAPTAHKIHDGDE